MSTFHLNRRDFLKSSGVAAGGLALGISFGSASAAGGDAGGDATEINAFIHIAEDGSTTLYCGRCEMGQGISTALPAAVADELEADWALVTVLQGDADEKYGPQATGGSNSINQMFLPMREAGAAAQAMLVSAAANRWGIDRGRVLRQKPRGIQHSRMTGAGLWRTGGGCRQPARSRGGHAESPGPVPLHWPADSPGRYAGGGHRHTHLRRRCPRARHEIRRHSARAGQGRQHQIVQRGQGARHARRD